MNYRHRVCDILRDIPIPPQLSELFSENMDDYIARMCMQGQYAQQLEVWAMQRCLNRRILLVCSNDAVTRLLILPSYVDNVIDTAAPPIYLLALPGHYRSLRIVNSVLFQEFLINQ